MAGYRKTIEKGTFEYRFYQALGFPPLSDDGGAPLVLRITLGDMELLDGFYMSLPAGAADVPIEEAIREYVLCQSEDDRIEVKQKLARDPNPDLLDIYDSLSWLYDQAGTGQVTLSYHINNGASDVPPTDLVTLHQQLCKTDGGGRPYRLLDLVLEVYHNLDPFPAMTDEQKEAVLRDFRGIFILYLMDKFGYQPMEAISQQDTAERKASDHLRAMLEYLASDDRGLLSMEDECSITPGGYEFLNSLIDEAEFYIDNYDIFGDVYTKGTDDVRFDTGYGDNLIVPVFVRQGIDPYRVLSIVALYLGNMDHLASDLDMLFSEEPFRDLFSLIVYSPTEEDIGTELLERIISEGSVKVQERKLREARLKHIESIERRMNSTSLFSKSLNQ